MGKEDEAEETLTELHQATRQQTLIPEAKMVKDMANKGGLGDEQVVGRTIIVGRGTSFTKQRDDKTRSVSATPTIDRMCSCMCVIGLYLLCDEGRTMTPTTHRRTPTTHRRGIDVAQTAHRRRAYDTLTTHLQHADDTPTTH